jgi:hypothetical protein
MSNEGTPVPTDAQLREQIALRVASTTSESQAVDGYAPGHQEERDRLERSRGRIEARIDDLSVERERINDLIRDLRLDEDVMKLGVAAMDRRIRRDRPVGSDGTEWDTVAEQD